MVRRAWPAAAVGAALVVATSLALSVGSAQAAQSGSWSMDSDCTACHTPQAVTAEEAADGAEAAEAGEEAAAEAEDESTGEAGTRLDVVHAAVADCTTCHNNKRVLQMAHKGVTETSKLPTRLARAEVPEKVCTSCHDKEALAEATADLDVLTDEHGTTVNPHDLPATSSHKNITCTSCHTVHEQSDPAATAMSNCTSCHHERVFECGTCHAKME